MKGNDILKAMNGIDGKYLNEQTEIRAGSGKRIRRPAAMIAAVCAALAMTVTAGAAVYQAFFHKESVEHYISGSDSLPETVCVSMENEHLRLTIDKLLYDGNAPLMIVTAESFDEEGRAIASESPAVYYSKTGRAEDRVYAGGAELIRGENEDPDIYKYVYELDYTEFDLSKPVWLHFMKGQFDECEPIEVKTNGEVRQETFAAQLNIEKNLDTADYYSADGRRITLSPIGAYIGEGFTLENPDDSLLRSMQFRYSDGRTEPLGDSHTRSFHIGTDTQDGVTTVEYERCFFGEVLDISGIDALIVQGTEFVKK